MWAAKIALRRVPLTDCPNPTFSDSKHRARVHAVHAAGLCVVGEILGALVTMQIARTDRGKVGDVGGS